MEQTIRDTRVSFQRIRLHETHEQELTYNRYGWERLPGRKEWAAAPQNIEQGSVTKI
jgi:hypothetical protein